MTDWCDQVHFEVSDVTAGRRLMRRLGHTWATLLVVDEPHVVAALVGSRPDDFATLMREVEAWVEEESLCAIRFIVDERVYVLVAGGADWSAHPWVAAEERSEESRAA